MILNFNLRTQTFFGIISILYTAGLQEKAYKVFLDLNRTVFGLNINLT